MGLDYYKILGVGKSANDDDLQKAFRRLDAMNKKEGEAKFKQIAEAYEVLSDPRKRAVYDRYGEAGLKGQVPPPGAGRPRSADDIFVDFFGSSSPFGGMGGGGSTSTDDIVEKLYGGGGSTSTDDIVEKLYGGSGSTSTDDIVEKLYGGGGGSTSTDDIVEKLYGFSIETFPAPRKAATIEKPLPCSLEELYIGTTKKMKISREILDARGKRMMVEEILTIDVKPGWKKGTKITFSEKGNESPNVVPADIVFIIDEKPHRLFSREGNDLVATQNISLGETMTGYTARLSTLDGRSLAIPISKVIHPGYEEVVPREGMPIPKDPSRKGNLRIKFDIKFPTRLTEEQKAHVKRALGP